jgi:predicted glycosyltransferase
MLTRKQVFDILYKKKGEGRSKRTEHLYNRLIKHFWIESDENIMTRLKAFNYKFCHSVYSRIDKCGRKIERFQKENEGWLNQQIVHDYFTNVVSDNCFMNQKSKYLGPVS